MDRTISLRKLEKSNYSLLYYGCSVSVFRREAKMPINMPTYIIKSNKQCVYKNSYVRFSTAKTIFRMFVVKT